MNADKANDLGELRVRFHPCSSVFIGGLILLAGIVYLAGNASVGLWDRDEPRYAQTSRQMLQSGDWVVPRFLGQVRTAKPPLIYWCQASAMKIFGDTAFAARLPSVIAMLLTIAVLHFYLRRRVDIPATNWACFILASSVLAIAAAKMCLTDSVLLLWITIAQGCLFEILQKRGTWPIWIALAIAVALAGLTKGPVVLGVMGTTLLAIGAMRWIESRSRLRESAASHRPIREAASGLVARTTIFKSILALAITIAIVAPWLILIHQREPNFLRAIIGHDVIDRMKTGLEGHTAPPGFYLLTIWGTFFPWSLFLPAAIVLGWKRRHGPLVRFAFAATIGPWIMFELIQTKLPHYLLPIFPPLAVLTALAIRDGNRRKTAAILGGATLLLSAIIYGLIFPHLRAIRLSQRLADDLRAAGASGRIIMIDYKEPSLAFAQGGSIREESDNAFLARTDPSSWPDWIVMTQTIFDTSPPVVRDRLEVVAREGGWWYANKGKHADVLVARKR